MSHQLGKLRGSLNVVDAGRAAGWAQDLARPDERVKLEILVGEMVIAQVIADLYRDELYRMGIGDGRYGFEVAIPNAFGGTGPLTVRRLQDRAILDVWPTGLKGWLVREWGMDSVCRRQK